MQQFWFSVNLVFGFSVFRTILLPEPTPSQNLFPSRTFFALCPLCQRLSRPSHRTLASCYRATLESLVAHIIMPLTSINSAMNAAASKESNAEVEDGSYVLPLCPHNYFSYMQTSLKRRLKVLTLFGA